VDELFDLTGKVAVIKGMHGPHDMFDIARARKRGSGSEKSTDVSSARSA
jgi:hypothetical protein